jgi:hypothetical protein
LKMPHLAAPFATGPPRGYGPQNCLISAPDMGIATSLAPARRFSLNLLRITAAIHVRSLPTFMRYTADGLASGLPKIYWTPFWRSTLRLTRQLSIFLHFAAPQTHSPLSFPSYSRRVSSARYGLSALRSTREAPHGVSLQRSGALATAVVHAPYRGVEEVRPTS